MDFGSRAPSALHRLAAWAVHGFTASGIVAGAMALFAVERGEWRAALLWLALALLIDGVDGPLARRLRVREVLPDFDGNVLDLVIDYFTYVVVPALLILRAGLVPAEWGTLAVAAILLSALYHYGRTDLKTADHYFNGFPAFWNVVAFQLYVWRPDPAAGLAAVLVLAGLTFAPVNFIHPLRVREWGLLAPAMAAVCGVSSVALLLGGEPWSDWLRALSLGSAAVLAGLGLLRTVRGPRPPHAPDTSGH